MPPVVELTVVPSRKKMIFTLRAADETKLIHEEVNPDRAADQKRVAVACGVAVPTVLGWFDRARQDAATGKTPTRFALAEAEPSDHLVWVRPIEGTRASVTPHRFADLAAGVSGILNDLTLADLLDWEDADALACLDVDYHGAVRPPLAEWVLTTAAVRLAPVPFAYHLSRGGGLHAFYAPLGPLTARECATLAAIRWRQADPNAGVEVKTQVRGPGDATVYRPVPSLGPALSWLTAGGEGEDIDGLAAGWLEEHGMELGVRYPHTLCPIDPNDTAEREPVRAFEKGIKCVRCEAKGYTFPGCSVPGFAPWSLLAQPEDGQRLGSLSNMVRHQTNWGHAKLVIEATTGLSGEMAKVGYRAALKLAHHGKPSAGLTPMAFVCETDRFARLNNRWGTAEESYVYPTTIAPLLATLPTCNFVTDEGKVVTNPAAVTLLQHGPLDLTDRGYPSVQVIRGVRLHTRYRDPTRLVVAKPAPWLRAYGPRYYPRYVDLSTRMDPDAARKLIEGVLPGIVWQYVEALILARACNEARVGLPQHLLVSGVTGAGKSSHVLLAAGILGDVATQVQFATDQDRFRASIRTASDAGSFVTFDEFLKQALAADRRMTADQVMDPLLNFTKDSLSHKMFHGPERLGDVGVCVWTETHIPEALKEKEQIARRVHYLRLRDTLNWEDGLAAHGIETPFQVRIVGREYADACNALMSDLIDRFLGVPQTFAALAAQIGVPKLTDSVEFSDPREKLREFFDAVVAAPDRDPSASSKERFAQGKGWKVIRRGDDGPLFDLWNDFSNGADDKLWVESTKLHEPDWKIILGTSQKVEFDSISDGKRVAVRFRVGPHRDPLLLNGGIVL